MPKLWQGIAAVHDMSGFGHMSRHIPGVQYYADRALLLPADIAVVMDDGEDLESHLAYLRRVGIGPSQVIRVKSANLIDGLDADFRAMETLDAHLRHGGMLQVFCLTESDAAFIERRRIDPRRIHSAPRSIAMRMNDKAEFRRIAKECGLVHAILPYVADRDPQVVMAAVKRFRAMPPEECEYPVIKLTDRAGGDGFMRVEPAWTETEVEERVRAYLRENSWNELAVTVHSELKRFEGQLVALGRADVRDIGRGVDDGIAKIRAIVENLFEAEPEADHAVLARLNAVGGASLRIRRGQPSSEAIRRFLLDHCRNRILVEAGFEGEDFSTQIVVDHGNFRFLGPTKQIVDAQGRHMGNIMTRFFYGTLAVMRLTSEDRQFMESFSYDLTKYAHTRVEGYRGTIGFDFRKRRRDGRVFALECNGRMTAATYPLAVSAQLDDGRFGEPLMLPPTKLLNWGIVMHNAVPTAARSWGALIERLGGLLFDGKSGALPFNVRLMRLERPHVGLVAVGRNLHQALAVMRLARRKLSK